ncbi:hypothetical protein KCF3NO3_21590 [Chryseobacterium sp. KCF3-3]
MKVIFYLINLITLIIIFVTPQSFHDDTTKSFDNLIITVTILNVLLGSLKKINIKKYNFYIVSLLQLIYCIITISYYDHNNFYWLRLFAIFSKENKVFNVDLLSSLDTLMYYIILIIVILHLRNLFLILFQIFLKDKKKKVT